MPAITANTDLPEGYKSFEKYVKVAGIPFVKKQAREWLLHLDNLWLEYELEPDNPIDKNAIKVIGGVKAGILKKVKRYHIGYIPAEIARLINEKAKTPGQILLLMRRLYIGEDYETNQDAFLEFTIDIAIFEGK